MSTLLVEFQKLSGVFHSSMHMEMKEDFAVAGLPINNTYVIFNAYPKIF